MHGIATPPAGPVARVYVPTDVGSRVVARAEQVTRR